ncbi:MAG: DHH family phosphoesterase [archaeon]
MDSSIKKAVKEFLEKSVNKTIRVVSHFDTDGITAAAIMSKALTRMDKTFSIKIVKQLDEQTIKLLPKKEFIVLLDLGSSNIDLLEDFENILVIDHHEITKKVPNNVIFINPRLIKEEEISGSGLTYFFVKEINQENKDLAGLGVIGMVGDMLDRELSKMNNNLLNDAEVVIKKGLLLYPSTRPLNKALEYSSSMYIPGVTGNSKGAINLLKEIGIERLNGEYKSLIELEDEEMSKLITSILLRRINKDNKDIIGNIYLVNFFNRLEDTREMSAMINACSRLDYSDIALSMCLGNKKSRIKAESIYANYKQHLVSALNYVSNCKKIEGKRYIIINAKNEIKDTIIGTVASILSFSSVYQDGTIIIAMAYDGNKIKTSARIVGRNGRNVHEILEKVVTQLGGGECGGHPKAAGCTIPRKDEDEFIKLLQKDLSIEMIKI